MKVGYIATIWKKLILNTSATGAIRLTAAHIVEKLQYDLSTGFHQCENFQAIQDRDKGVTAEQELDE